jgi:hypothetical protein
MINQWKNSIKWCEFIDEMSYTESFIKIESLFEDDNIKMQDLIRFNSAFCEDFLHQSMHLRDDTRLAINCFRWFIFIFFDHLNIINFLQLMNDLESAMIKSQMSKSRRRLCRSEFSWLNRICMLILNRVEFQQQNIAMHAYFAYLRVWFHMHQDVSMQITIISLLDQPREQNESNCWFTSTVMIRFKSVYCMSVVYWLNWVLLIKLSDEWSICRMRESHDPR